MLKGSNNIAQANHIHNGNGNLYVSISILRLFLRIIERAQELVVVWVNHWDMRAELVSPQCQWWGHTGTTNNSWTRLITLLLYIPTRYYYILDRNYVVVSLILRTESPEKNLFGQDIKAETPLPVYSSYMAIYVNTCPATAMGQDPWQHRPSVYNAATPISSSSM